MGFKYHLCANKPQRPAHIQLPVQHLLPDVPQDCNLSRPQSPRPRPLCSGSPHTHPSGLSVIAIRSSPHLTSHIKSVSTSASSAFKFRSGLRTLALAATPYPAPSHLIPALECHRGLLTGLPHLYSPLTFSTWLPERPFKIYVKPHHCTQNPPMLPFLSSIKARVLARAEGPAPSGPGPLACCLRLPSDALTIFLPQPLCTVVPSPWNILLVVCVWPDPSLLQASAQMLCSGRSATWATSSDIASPCQA